MSKMLLGGAAALGLLALASAPLQAQAQTAVPDGAALPRAITAIERNGGKVLEIRTTRRPGVTGYDAVVSKGDVISRVTISEPFSNVTVIAERDKPVWMADWSLKTDRRDVRHAKISLARAVREAERDTKAPAVDAALATPEGGTSAIIAYNVEVMKDGSPERVAIDARTGDRIANPDALLAGWTPEQAFARSHNG